MKTAEAITQKEMIMAVAERSEKMLKVPRSNNAATRALFAEWRGDESDYDTQAWPLVKVTLEENRLSERKRFSDEAPAL